MKSFKERIEYNSKKEQSNVFTKGEVIIGKEKVSK